jgi:hypothetical protein
MSAKSQLYKYFIQIGKEIFGTNSSKVAKDLADQGGKRIPKSKIKADSNVKKAPTVANPKSSKTGQYTSPKPITRPRTTTVKKPKAPSSTSVTKPKTQTTSVSKPKVKSTSPAVIKPKSAATPKRKPPLMPKDMVKVRTNAPKNLTSRPAALRDLARPEAPTLDLKSPSEERTDRKFVPSKTETTKKTSKPSTAPARKTAPPKKEPTLRPKARPAQGPVTNESFGKAFARNRKAGNATFMWKGNKYTTRLKEESISQHKKKFGVEGKY